MKTTNRIQAYYDASGRLRSRSFSTTSDPAYLDLDPNDDGGTWQPMTWRQTVQNWLILATAGAFWLAVAAVLMRAAGLR